MHYLSSYVLASPLGDSFTDCAPPETARSTVIAGFLESGTSFARISIESIEPGLCHFIKHSGGVMKIKFVKYLIASLILGALCACNGKNPQNYQQATPTPTTQPAPAPTTQSAPTPTTQHAPSATTKSNPGANVIPPPL